MVISEFCIRSDGHHHIRIYLHNRTFLLGLCIGSLLRNRSGDDGVRGDDHIHKCLLRIRSGDDVHDDGDVRDGGDHDHSIHILLPLLQGVLQH